jgi:transcriptional regulator with XRE-family HTH domain
VLASWKVVAPNAVQNATERRSGACRRPARSAQSVDGAWIRHDLRQTVVAKICDEMSRRKREVSHPEAPGGGEEAAAHCVAQRRSDGKGGRDRYNYLDDTGDDLNRLVTTPKAPRGARFNFRSIGGRLRAYRMAAELRSEDVAERLDISRAAIYKLERGEIVKIDTLERLAALFNVSLANLLGVEVEYHDSAVSYFERMRQLESRSAQIVAHFDPFSFLLTSDGYGTWLRNMLEESIPPTLADANWARTIDRVLEPLLTTGRVDRAWLGLALHPVAVPEALRAEGDPPRGLMVMEVSA